MSNDVIKVEEDVYLDITVDDRFVEISDAGSGSSTNGDLDEDETHVNALLWGLSWANLDKLVEHVDKTSVESILEGLKGLSTNKEVSVVFSVKSSMSASTNITKV